GLSNSHLVQRNQWLISVLPFFPRPSLKRVGRKGLSLGSIFPVTRSPIRLPASGESITPAQ
ncbi:MAG: hypothetical protein U9Q05_06215, partial [Thermodesulfobacteriota bacterium]|nr:hypothetical protein [Thermodesulfobacteriota bacterium]